MERNLNVFENAVPEAYVSPELAVINLNSEGVFCSSVGGGIDRFDDGGSADF